MIILSVVLVLVSFFAGALWNDTVFKINRRLRVKSVKKKVDSLKSELEYIDKVNENSAVEFRLYFMIILLTLAMISLHITISNIFSIVEITGAWAYMVFLPVMIWGVGFPALAIKSGLLYGDKDNKKKLEAKIKKIEAKYPELDD